MIGKGAYQLCEAARYTGVPASTLRAWFMPGTGHAALPPIFQAEYRTPGEPLELIFLNLMEAFVGRFFRQNGVSSAQLRAAHQALADHLGAPHPFAHCDLCTGHGRILKNCFVFGRAAEVVDVVSRQTWFPQMKRWLAHLDYDASSCLVARWRIADGVEIDPRIAFGQPVVNGAGVTTCVLANQVAANGGNAALVADLFDLPESSVMDAARFEADYRSPRKAA